MVVVLFHFEVHLEVLDMGAMVLLFLGFGEFLQ